MYNVNVLEHVPVHYIHYGHMCQYIIRYVYMYAILCLFYQRFPADKAYYIAKELLMTERTYKKDLEVLTVVSARRSRFS